MAPKYEAANFWLTLPAAMLAAGIAAFAVGVFVVRVKGVYFIMVTLAFAQMFYFLFTIRNSAAAPTGSA
jgi:branched-chain amino acid transport system permease protein